MIATRDIRNNLKIIKSKSSGYISPSFGVGYLYECSYCHIKEIKPKGLSISKNVNQIL